MLIILLSNLHRKKIKQEDKMSIKLCVNIYIVIWIYACLLISTNIQSILGDLYAINFDSFSCILIGYVLLIILYMFYMTFINQVINLKSILFSHSLLIFEGILSIDSNCLLSN